MQEVWAFIKAVIAHWTAFLTGTLIVVALWAYEHYKGQNISFRIAVWVMAFALAVAGFLAWRDQYRGWNEERAYRSRVADEFASLRHTAQKHYYEWWEACQNPAAAQPAKQAAEEMRLKIVDKLQKEISLAEADYFNTPRMFEPFPANRNLIACPEAALINEFGYRIQRLSDIIQRLLQRGPSR